jgi:hypothetical protein
LVGNVLKPRQLNAALYVRPVSAATADVPPSASMTSEVVLSEPMAEAYNPTSLGNQAPKKSGLPNFPSFFNKPSMGRPIKNQPQPGTPAERVRKLREAMGYQTQKSFAVRYGFTPNQWTNYENGSPVSRQAAQSLARQISGVTTGWILDNETAGLSLTMARKLGILPPEAS